MAFDAAAIQKALTPPSITVAVRPAWWQRLVGFLVPWYEPPTSRTYTGRILSIIEWAPFGERWAKVNHQEVTEDEGHELAIEYLDAIGIPSRVLLALPPALFAEAMADFLACQVSASRLRTIAGAKPGPPADGSPNGSPMNKAMTQAL